MFADQAADELLGSPIVDVFHRSTVDR